MPYLQNLWKMFGNTHQFSHWFLRKKKKMRCFKRHIILIKILFFIFFYKKLIFVFAISKKKNMRLKQVNSSKPQFPHL